MVLLSGCYGVARLFIWCCYGVARWLLCFLGIAMVLC